MKICVVGAGAIGGMLAVKLAEAGQDVTVIIRGANLKAVRDNGMKLIMDDGSEHVATFHATDRITDAGPQDIVILGLKAHQLTPVAAELKAIIAPETTIITAQNGVPWWYFFKHGGPFEGKRLESVDPGGVIADNIDVDKVVGCIVYPAGEIVAPGVIRHIEGSRFSLGELDGTDSERIRAITQLFRDAGFKAPVVSDIRTELWIKLWGNCTFNPLSALTHATLADICQFPETRELAGNMMREAQTIAEKLGIVFRISLEKRIAGAEGVGQHKTSMLQDVEAGRPMELGALVASVIELGGITETPVPYLTAVYACASLLAKTLRDEKGRLRVEPPG